MDRKNFYLSQLVLEGDLDAAFAQAEQQFWDTNKDISLFGVVTGLTPTLGSAPTVDITKGVAYDQLGRRVKAYSDGASTKNRSYATTTGGSSTSVGSGNERWISIFMRWGRKTSDTRVDGNGNSVDFQREENLNSNDTAGGVDFFYIVAGTEAAVGTATRPALESDKVLVCDIKRTFNDVSNVLDTTRRQIGPFLSTGTVIQMAAGPNWLGGRTNPAPATLQAALDKIINDLGATTSSDDGAERIGAQAAGNLSSGSVRSQLDSLDAAKGGLALDNTWTGENTQSRSTITNFHTKYPQASGFRLIWGVDGASSTDGGVRAYIEGNGRLYLTTNARWDGSNWNKDVTTRESIALVIGIVTAGLKSHAALLWRTAVSGTWANTFGVSTGWEKVLDFTSTRNDWIGGSGGSLGTGVGTTLFEADTGEAVGNVNGIASDNYFFGVTGYNGSAGVKLYEIQPFRRRYTVAPSAGTVTNDTALLADVGTSLSIAIQAVNETAFSFYVDGTPNGSGFIGRGARVTFTR